MVLTRIHFIVDNQYIGLLVRKITFSSKIFTKRDAIVELVNTLELQKMIFDEKNNTSTTMLYPLSKDPVSR